MLISIYDWDRPIHDFFFSPFFLITLFFLGFSPFYTMQWTVTCYERIFFVFSSKSGFKRMNGSRWMSSSNNILFVSGFGFYYFVFWNRLTQNHRISKTECYIRTHNTHTYHLHSSLYTQFWVCFFFVSNSNFLIKKTLKIIIWSYQMHRHKNKFRYKFILLLSLFSEKERATSLQFEFMINFESLIELQIPINVQICSESSRFPNLSQRTLELCWVQLFNQFVSAYTRIQNGPTLLPFYMLKKN